MSVINGINFAYKNNVVARTTADISLTYVALPIIDDVQLKYGDRVLIMNQANDVDNGIYVALSYSFNRDTDSNTAFSFVDGAIVRVVGGTVHANTEWFISPIAALDYPTASKIFVTSPFIGSGGGGSVGAANGLSLVSSNIELGGTLTKNTSIDLVKQVLNITSASGSIMYINGDTGNTGVGTTTPNYKFEIIGSNNSSILVVGDLTTTIATAIYATRALFGTTSAHDLGFITGGSERLTILNNGNVGIGLTPPSTSTLYVYGKTAAFGQDAIRVDSVSLGTVFAVEDYVPRVRIGTTYTTQPATLLLGNNSATQYFIGFSTNSELGAMYSSSNQGMRIEYYNKARNEMEIFMSTDPATLTYQNAYVSASFRHNLHIGNTPNSPYDFNNTIRLYVKGVDTTLNSYVMRLDNSNAQPIMSVRNDSFVDINVDTNYARILSLNPTVSSPTFVVYGNTGEALRVEGHYGRVFMGGAATTFNDAATLNIGGYGLGRYIFFGLNGNQATITDADGSGIIFTGKQKNLSTTEFKLVSDEGLLVGNNHTTAYFRRNVDIGGGGTGDTVSRLVVVGETSDATKNALSLTNLSGTSLFKVRNDGALFTGASQGASGTFTSNDGKTVTVTNGLITSIV